MERFMCGSEATQGKRHSSASSEVRWQGQHTTQVFPIPFDSCNMIRLLASNELDLVGGSDIGIGRHAEIHEPFFVPTKGGRNWMQVGGIENDASRTSGQDTELQAVRWKTTAYLRHVFQRMHGSYSKLCTEERVELGICLVRSLHCRFHSAKLIAHVAKAHIETCPSGFSLRS